MLKCKYLFYFAIVFFFVSYPNITLSDIYMYTDKNGEVHFTNVPPFPDAKPYVKEKQQKEPQDRMPYRDSSMGFQINFPCTTQKKGITIKNTIVNTYYCETIIGDETFYYSVAIAANKDNTHIRFKKKDINEALKNFVIGRFLMFGVSPEEITFRNHSNFQGKYPTVYYYFTRNKIIAEGLSCLIEGKQFRIGMIYKKNSQTIAKIRLQSFLNSFKSY